MSANFTPEQKEYKDYKGFGTFKMFVLQNFPFIAEDFDALTYYQMLCKIVEYLKDVIENNKAIQDNQTGLLDAYNQLQNFVNTYFDNLDVSKEVNAKLDVMASDGTLANIINQDIYNDIHNRMNNLESDLNSNIENLNEESNEIKEYMFKTPYIPASRNIKQNTPKFVNYNPTNKEITAVQKCNTGYLIYTFNTANGDTSDASVGLAWDLIRLKKVQFSPFAYVFKDTYNSTVGNLTVLSPASIINSQFEKDMFSNVLVKSVEPDAYYKNKESIAVYGLASADGTTPAEVNYKLKFNTSGKANILFYCSSGSTKNVDIIVDGKTIANLDLSSFARNSINCFYTYNFDIPQIANDHTNKIVDVVIRNNDTARTMYFACMNYLPLEKYDGREYDSFKASASGTYYINHNGSSDYAIYDSDLNKFMGSFHGGEIALQQQILSPYLNDDQIHNANIEYYNSAMYTLRNLPTTERYYITPFFEILQVTNLNNKGKMISTFDFNSDGQLEMNFNFFDGNVNTTSFFTGLTCNSKSMDLVKFPDNVSIVEGENYLMPNNGLISFTSNTTRLRMDILYSKFYDEHINPLKKNGYVLSNNSYNKHYYGAIMESENPVNVKNLCFKKILDFYLH